MRRRGLEPPLRRTTRAGARRSAPAVRAPPPASSGPSRRAGDAESTDTEATTTDEQPSMRTLTREGSGAAGSGVETAIGLVPEMSPLGRSTSSPDLVGLETVRLGPSALEDRLVPAPSRLQSLRESAGESRVSREIAEDAETMLNAWDAAVEGATQGTLASYFASEMREQRRESQEGEKRASVEFVDALEIVSASGSDKNPPPVYRGKWNELELWQIDEAGNAHRRRMSRVDILTECRKGLSEDLPPLKRIGSWLVAVDPAPELKEFQERMGMKPSKKKDTKLLRRFLKSALQLRDIRQVDPGFSAKSCLWVRHSAYVFAMEDVRAIVCHDRVYLFDPDNQRTIKALKVLQQRLVVESDVEDAFMPFELRALEGLLVCVVTGLETDFIALEPELRSSLLDLPSRLTSSMLENLRSNQQRLNHFHSRVEKVHRVLQDLLEEDDDMAAMYLTEKHKNPDIKRNPIDHDEVEALLEAYLQVVDDLTSKAELLDQAVEDTEDLVGIHLDTLRNKLLMVQLSLAIIGMMLTFGSLVAGIFGMNLTLPIFESPNSEWWFLGVCLSVILVVVGVSYLVHFYLRRLGLYTPI